MSFLNQRVVIYAIPGSQFTHKVIAALQARKIPHYVEFVPLDLTARRKFLPSGGTMVPEMTVGKGDERVVVTDSEAILRWLDENMDGRLYPSELAGEISVRASTKTLAGCVWYYNWVNQKGYENSMRASLAKHALPWWWMPTFLKGPLVDFVVRDQRTKHRQWASQAIGVSEDDLDDEQRMHGILMEELMYFQSFLGKPSSQQPFLLPDAESTAADFSVYAQLERLVGAGTASDVHIDPAYQELKDNGNGLERLWEWHDLMRERYPVQFKGKRVPKDDD